MNRSSFVRRQLGASVLRVMLALCPAVALAVCNDCGRVVSVQQVTTQGKTSGVGAVVGGVGGAVIGNQFGSGTGRTAMTVAGAAGGAYVGNRVEKSRKTKKKWVVSVDMESGGRKSFNYSRKPEFREGDNVMVRDGKLLLVVKQ